MQLRQHEAELESLNVRVAVVAFQAGPVVAAYVRETNLTWPILIDDSLRLYSAYGMERGRWSDLVGPAAIGLYFKLMARGRRPRSAAGADVKQLGGDVLVDPSGVVRFHHVGSGPADRPAIADLLAVVRGVSGLPDMDCGPRSDR